MNEDIKFSPKNVSENHNISKTHPLAEFAKLLVGLGVSFLFFFLSLGLVTDYLVEKHHLRLSRMFRGSPAIFASALKIKLGDKSSLDYNRVNTVFNKLLAASGLEERGYQVHLSESPDVNAYAFPGGHIVVLKGLLNTVSSDEELAFVLGHEIAHQENKDSFRAVGRGLALVALAAFFSGSDSTTSSFFIDLSNLASSQYSQSQEQSADELGLDILNNAYSNVGGAIAFLEAMKKKESSLDKFIFKKSHPLTDKRITFLRQLIQEKGYSGH